MVDTRATQASHQDNGDWRPSRSACRRVSRRDGRRSPAVRSPEDGSTRLSLRPILDGAGYRPYYVGGYAGASYGPGLFRPRRDVGGGGACGWPTQRHGRFREPGRRNESTDAIRGVMFIGSRSRISWPRAGLDLAHNSLAARRLPHRIRFPETIESEQEMTRNRY